MGTLPYQSAKHCWTSPKLKLSAKLELRYFRRISSFPGSNNFEVGLHFKLTASFKTSYFQCKCLEIYSFFLWLKLGFYLNSS